MEIKMEKVATLNDDQYNRIAKDGKLGKDIRETLGIPKTKKVNIGDTVCKIGELSKTKEVFKYIQNKKTVFYIIISPINEELAMCYSIY